MKVQLGNDYYHMEQEQTKQSLAFMQRSVAFLKRLNRMEVFSALVLTQPSFGGYIGIECSSFYSTVHIRTDEHMDEMAALRENLENRTVDNVYETEYEGTEQMHVIFDDVGQMYPKTQHCIYMAPTKWSVNDSHIEYYWQENHMFVYVPIYWEKTFGELFYCSERTFQFDNLVEVCMIVRNGGQLLEEMLVHNREFIDHWTIVDTGSTDDTVQRIENTLIGKQSGKLFFCDFENFEQARNVALDLCEKHCTYTMVLDDSYFIHGDIRSTLSRLREEEQTSCYSVQVERSDIHFMSTILFRTMYNFRFKGALKERLDYEQKPMALIPGDEFFIEDKIDSESIKRTRDRQIDFEIPQLLKRFEQNPNDEKIIYQLGETYLGLGQWEEALQFYKKRLTIIYRGELLERWNAAFEMGRIYQNHYAKEDSNLFLSLYDNAEQIDPSRPESSYMKGIFYYQNQQMEEAFYEFKKAFDIGIPGPFFFKSTMYYFFIPHYVFHLAIRFEDGDYASRAMGRLEENKVMIQRWEFEKHLDFPFGFFQDLSVVFDQWSHGTSFVNRPDKPIICFVAPFGWNTWSGSQLKENGVGGSETFVAQLAETMQNGGDYSVHVFCECKESEEYNFVSYHPLSEWTTFAKKNYIKYCVVNRSIKHVSLATILPQVENVYLMLHDFAEDLNDLVDHFKLKSVFCVSKELLQYASSVISFSNKLEVFEPGVPVHLLEGGEAVPWRFHYSSTANRGLRILLHMWPRIVEMNAKATLHIYSDLDNPWANAIDGENIAWIQDRKNELENTYGVVFHSFVGKDEIYRAWQSADIWLYPCVFAETFCITALEAAASNTLVICPGTAGLATSVGDRGIVISGDPNTILWQEEAFHVLGLLFSGKVNDKQLRKRNNFWAKTMDWRNREKIWKTRLERDYVEYRNVRTMVNSNSSDVFQSLLHVTKRHTSILIISDSKGILTEYFCRHLPESSITVVNDNNAEEEQSFEVNVKNFKNFKVVRNNYLNTIIYMIKQNQKFDIIYLNRLPKQNVLLNNVVFLLQTSGVLLVEKMKNVVYGDNSILQRHFENQEFVIFSKSYVTQSLWKPDEEFMFSRDIGWEKIMQKYLSSAKRAIEIGVGSSSIFCYKFDKTLTSYMWDTPFVESFENYAKEKGYCPRIELGPPIKISEPCFLIINNMELAESIEDYATIDKILIRNNVSSFQQKLTWETKLMENGFHLIESFHGEHPICPFRHVEYWEKATTLGDQNILFS